MGKKANDLEDAFGGMKLKAMTKKSDDLEDMFGGMKLAKKHAKQPLIALPHCGQMGPCPTSWPKRTCAALLRFPRSRLI